MEKNSTLEAYLTPGAEMENMKSPETAATNTTAETPQRLFSSNQKQNENETYENLE
jgi:hypothetical protein